MGNQSKAVRLIGIDTPETKDLRKVVQCFGAEASARASQLMKGREVWLESDPSQASADRYGRLLAYVWLDDTTMVNEVMVAEGFAHEYRYDADYKYRQLFLARQQAAEDTGRGLWDVATCSGDTGRSAD